ncbi:hypothetical protein Ccrd_000816 [Cynara cardunculus var. scolymus]|uniref:Uncharacterized protein n=1 Tax=Cynara cardunculus var. scolymus TaxID=59895 RepID=A0A103XUG2_CYNCS|nr:hypothetical protein Ccrd_000816 [Cynara cardunculus var. scolymus]
MEPTELNQIESVFGYWMKILFLLPLQQLTSFLSSASFSYHASSYTVESRARVIMFDVAGFEGSRTLQRRTSSLISHGDDNPVRSPSGDHAGLMSWPQRHIKSFQHLEHPSGNINNFSARAMQLSMYGSMVSRGSRTSPNELAKPSKKPSHSRSYPIVPPTFSRQLISVRSEGSTTVTKVGETAREPLTAPRGNTDTIDTREMDYSSDESGAEDEHIVRIDSPSTLSFPRAP